MTKQAVFNFALKVFLFLSPIFYFGAYKLSYTQGMFFVFGSFVLFGISLGKQPKRSFSNPWMALFLLWALIRVFATGDFGNNSSEWFNFWLSTAGFIYILAGVLLFHTIYCHAENPRNYLTPILIVCSMNLVLVIAQLIGHDFMWTHTRSIGGFIGISSQLGQYSAMSIPIVAFINPWLAIIPLLTLFASNSASSILATFIIIGAFLILKGANKKIVAGVVALLVIWLAFNFTPIMAKFQCRPVMWEKTLKVALQRPYLGHGYKSFHKEVVGAKTICSVGGLEYARPHNDYLHTMQELGAPMVIFIGGFFAGLWRMFRAKEDKDKLTYLLAASVLIVLVNSCAQTLFRYASISGTFIVMLAFLSIKVEVENGRHKC